jgi:phage baseplate assembly protein W
MPIPQTIQINPLDVQGNIAIGVSLPFNGPAAFKSTYSTKDQIKSNLLNVLLTNRGERVFNPRFGLDLRRVIFEGITDDLETKIRSLIFNGLYDYIPQISIIDIIVQKDEDHNTISVTVQYRINISQTPDQVTIEFT